MYQLPLFSFIRRILVSGVSRKVDWVTHENTLGDKVLEGKKRGKDRKLVNNWCLLQKPEMAV